MAGCQNYGSFWGPEYGTHLVFRGPEKAHNFDNHPYVFTFWLLGSYDITVKRQEGYIFPGVTEQPRSP